MLKLRFSKGNAKLANDTAIFSLPAGHTCPFAKDCLSKADEKTGKLTDDAACKFRCYAASAENIFSNVRKSRWFNYQALLKKSSLVISSLIEKSLPRKGIKLVRIHSSGDFFSQTYFDAWLNVAKNNPGLTFYSYTKALPYWVKRLKDIPTNFKLTASKGGKFDSLITKHNLKTCSVVFSESEASKKGLELDHDDKLAWCGDKSFAILLHGTQPAGSQAGKSLHKLRKAGKGGYKADYFAHYKGTD